MTFDRIVGILSLVASLAALWAARTARQVAKETREQVSQARLSVEIGKLQTLAISLKRGVQGRNWDYASEKCTEILSQQAEMANRFKDFDNFVERKTFDRFAARIRSIGGTCSEMQDSKVDNGVAKLVTQIDKQIEYLSAIYGVSQQQVEAQIVKR